MNRKVLFFLTIIGGIILSVVLKQIFAPNPHKNFSKSHNFCLRISKCSDHSLPVTLPTGDDTMEEVNILDHKDLINLRNNSKKLCSATQGEVSYRKKYKCHYNEVGNSIGECSDCANPQVKKKKNEDGSESTVKVCANAGHDINFTGNIPKFDECLSIMGYSKYDKNPSSLEVFNDYNIDIPEKGKDGKPVLLNDDWWDSKDYLFKCIMGSNEYLSADYEDPDDVNMGDGINSVARYINCTHCGNLHKNKEGFDKCFNIATNCYKSEYSTDECIQYETSLMDYSHLA
jgi:hypothetical protein